MSGVVSLGSLTSWQTWLNTSEQQEKADLEQPQIVNLKFPINKSMNQKIYLWCASLRPFSDDLSFSVPRQDSSSLPFSCPSLRIPICDVFHYLHIYISHLLIPWGVNEWGTGSQGLRSQSQVRSASCSYSSFLPPSLFPSIQIIFVMMFYFIISMEYFGWMRVMASFTVIACSYTCSFRHFLSSFLFAGSSGQVP